MTLASPSPAEVLDSDLLDHLLVVEPQTRYPRDSRAYVRIDVSHRLFWHTLFDVCPKALELTSPDGLEIFRPFMAWAKEQNLTFDWSYFIWVYHWLSQSEFRDRLSEDLLIEMMGASAARWANLNRDADAGLVLGRPGFPRLVVAWKQHTVETGREVELIELEEPLPDPEGPFGYFTLPGFEFDAFPGWRPIPR